MSNEYFTLVGKLPEIIESCNYDTDQYDIKFKEVPTQATSELNDTVYRQLVVLVQITNKSTGASIKQPINILNIPAQTSLGFKIDKNFYTPMSIDKRAIGWYITDRQFSSSSKIPTLEFVPKSGIRLFFIERQSEIQVILGRKENYNTRINLGVFLKALTGKSYQELIMLLGPHNRFVTSSLILENELDRDTCVLKTLKQLMPTAENIPSVYRSKELFKRFRNKHFFNAGDYKPRMLRNFKFRERAKGCTLLKSVLDIPRGTILDEQLLEKIDTSGIDTLLVKLDKVYELKKYPIGEETLGTNELLTAINMFACSLDGFPTKDDAFELTNRRTHTFVDEVTDRVESRLDKIITSVDSYFREHGETASVSTIKLPTFDIDEFIRVLKSSDSGLIQGSEFINSVAYAAKQDKVDSDLKGRGGESSITIKDTETGIYDGFAQPESKKVGKVHYKTLTSRRDSDGVLKATFLKVENGEVVNPDGEPILLDPYTFTNSYVAPWDADLSAPRVKCMKHGKQVEIPREEVEYIEWSALNKLSITTASIPFSNHSSGKRLTMGDNMQKQAVITLGAERPLVSTGVCGIQEIGLIKAKDILAYYYAAHSNILEYEYEEFIKLPIKLVTTDLKYHGYRLTCYEVQVPNDKTPLTIQYVAPFNKRTIDDTFAGYRIRPSKDYIYQGDDIVLFDSSVDINKYDLKVYADLGYQKVDESKFATDAANGVNLRVAYKTFDSVTMDDATAICAGLLGTNKLAHIIAQEYKSTLSSHDDSFEEFTIYGNLPEFEANGLPRVGTYLKPKSVVISKVMHLASGEVKFSPVTLDAESQGIVTKAIIENGQAIVQIAQCVDAQVGDKMSGSYGNKCVIAKIVPESQMPYTPDGRPIDIMLNPLSVPSRMNISQFLEALLGLVARLQGDDTRYVVTPGFKDSYNLVKNLARSVSYPWSNKVGIGTTTLYDGRTGKPFPREVNYGEAYFKKLRHTVGSKSNCTGLNFNVNPETSQPRKGKRVAGGQTIGEMETWALIASGAYHILQEFSSIQSDDIKNKKQLKLYAEKLNTDEEIPFPKCENHNDSALRVAPRALGIDLRTENGKYVQVPMTDKDICSLAAKPIELNRKSLQDSSIFGSLRNAAGLMRTRERWGYMPLNCEVVHPIYLYEYELLRMIPVRKKVLDEQLNTHKFVDAFLNPLLVRNIIRTKGIGNFIKPLAESDKSYIAIKNGEIFLSDDNTIPSFEWMCGMPAIVSALRNANLEKAKALHLKKLESKMESGSLSLDDEFKIRETISSIDNVIEKYGNLEFAIIRHFPIMPINYRVPAKGRPANFDILYGNIISAVTSSKTVDKSTEVYLRILEFTGLENNIRPSKEGTASVLTYFTGKNTESTDGLQKDKILSKVVDMSCRGVIVPAETGELKITEVGIPYKKALTMLKIFILPRLLEADSTVTERCVSEDSLDAFYNAIIIKDFYELASILGVSVEEARTKLINYISLATDVAQERVALLGRQPTLHRLGIRGYSIKLVDGDATKLHQLVCSMYNADFDGDQMHNEIPLSEEAQNEAIRLMSPASSLINPKDGSFILEPTQDALLGCYLMTMLKYNVTTLEELPDYYNKDNIVHYDNLVTLSYDVEMSIIEPYQLVCYHSTKLDSYYLSTAGRILFNSLLPNGFTKNEFTNPLNIPDIVNSNYNELSFDSLVAKKVNKNIPINMVAMSAITKSIYSNFGGMDTCRYLDEIFKFGCRSTDRLGFTLSLDDLIEHPDLDRLNTKASSMINNIHKQYNMGLLSDKGRRDATTRVYSVLTKYVESTLLSHYPRNNNMFILIESGARGNLGQLMQTCGCVGSISRTTSENLETFILSNYTRGLSSDEQTLISYGTRIGVSSTQNDTATAGALTHSAVYTLAGLRVVEYDCHHEPSPLKVDYSDNFTSIKVNGTSVTQDELIGAKISPNDKHALEYQSLDALHFTSNILYYIKKNKIRELLLESGETVQFKYALSDIFKNWMLNRQATDLPFLETALADSHTGIITRETIQYIEDENLESIKVRTMLSCKSSGGVCAKCYGLESDVDRTYPQIGTEVGVIAAQSLGEPAAQIIMNVINSGGKAGSSATSGVKAFTSRMHGSVPGTADKNPRSVVAPIDGYVHLEDLGKDTTKLSIAEFSTKANKQTLLVKEGEFVHRGDVLTDDTLDVNDIVLETPADTLAARQLALMKVFYKIFHDSDIKINARIFEVVVRAQLSIVRVLESENPDYKPGYYYFLADIERALEEHPDKKIYYYMRVEKDRIVGSMYGGHLANIVNSYFAQNLLQGALIPNRTNSNNVSSITRLAIGENLVTKTTKVLSTPAFFNKDTIEREAVSITNEELDRIHSLVSVINEKDSDADSSYDLLADVDFNSILEDDLGVTENTTTEEPTPSPQQAPVRSTAFTGRNTLTEDELLDEE